MTDVCAFAAGTTPLLVSIPHDGRALAPGQERRMTATGRALPDTDWHVGSLYEFVRAAGATVVAANYSRYVIDVNRGADDAGLYPGRPSTGLCPTRSFAGEPLYADGEAPTAEEVAMRLAGYWDPYHRQLADSLAAIRERHGFAVLWDAHSIASRVPRLFDGVLPDLNVGTHDGASCAPGVGAAVFDVARRSGFTAVLNGRFRGGYITRRYGAPGDGVHAVQLELAQHCYMDEASGRYDAARAATLRATIHRMLDAALDAARAAAGA